MKSKLGAIICVMLLLAVASVVFADDLVMFNYQGRVRVQGTAFDGTGYFKFAIVNNPGTITLWSNDETSVGGSEPSASVSVTVTDGIFNVMVGDPDLGMQPINRSIFNHPSRIKLRIWFSDGTHGFQRLLPDRRIINPQLIGLVSGTEDFTIYVNGTTGNDENNGLTTDTAKRTIQASVDVLADRLHCNVTIDITNGVYREEVRVFGITVEPGKSLTFLGDESWAPSSPGDPAVRITGKDDDTTATIVRDNAFRAQKCSNIVLKGILFDYATGAGVGLYEGSYKVYNCKASHCSGGFSLSLNSSGSFSGCVAEHSVGSGFSITRNSSANLTNCDSQYNGHFGVYSIITGSLSFYESGEFSNNSKSGMHILHNSRAWFAGGYSGYIRDNADYGMEIRYDSYVEDYNKNTFSGNGLGNLLVNNGGHTYF